MASVHPITEIFPDPILVSMVYSAEMFVPSSMSTYQLVQKTGKRGQADVKIPYAKISYIIEGKQTKQEVSGRTYEA
jgi:hypothetical protein